MICERTMRIDAELVERLLLEEESTVLDFKRRQYPFVGAEDAQKAELLKDILAFANAWRRSDAFVLIGVEEWPGRRSRVVGVSHHLEDSALQQFVNSKTQRPVTFSYRALKLDSRQVGVLHLPVQERPRYLRQRFGHLKPQTVYVRRGSSTAEADPDEVAQMGAEEDAVGRALPKLELRFDDHGTKTEFSSRKVDADLAVDAKERKLAERTVRVDLELHNLGDAAATDVDVLLDFRVESELKTEVELKHAWRMLPYDLLEDFESFQREQMRKRQLPPLKRSFLEASDAVRFHLLESLVASPRTDSRAARYAAVKVKLDSQGAQFHLEKLKHGMSRRVESLYCVFESRRRLKSFVIEATLNSVETGTTGPQTLSVKVLKRN